MAIIVNDTTPRNQYTATSSQTAFTYAFEIFTVADIKVYNGSTLLTYASSPSDGTEYSVSNAGVSGGGTVTLGSGGATSGDIITIVRDIPVARTTDFPTSGPFVIDSLNTDLDKMTAMVGEREDEIQRSIRLLDEDSTATLTLPLKASRLSKTLGFDSSGNLTVIEDFLPAGGDSSQMTYSTTTTDSDPGTGVVRLNNTTLASATIAYIDDAEANGTDISAWIQSFDDVTGNASNRGRIRISKANSLTVWAVYKVNGTITDASGYSKIPISYIDGAGSFTNSDTIFISFTASGEDGAIPGYYYKFDTGTSDADPGAGEISFNNGTYASVTTIYIDDVDANGATTQTDTATWGASTSTIKGYLHVVDINDSTTYARFKITAAVVDASGYNKITVAHLA